MGGGEIEQNTEDMDPQRAAEMARKHPEAIVGSKPRITPSLIEGG